MVEEEGLDEYVMERLELDDGHLEAQTEPEERQVVLAGVADRLDLPFGATGAKAAGDDEAVDVV